MINICDAMQCDYRYWYQSNRVRHQSAYVESLGEVWLLLHECNSADRRTGVMMRCCSMRRSSMGLVFLLVCTKGCSVWFVQTTKTFGTLCIGVNFSSFSLLLLMPLSSMFFFCHCNSVVWLPKLRLSPWKVIFSKSYFRE